MLVYQRVNVTTYSSTMDPMGNWGRVHTTNEGVSKQTMRFFFYEIIGQSWFEWEIQPWRIFHCYD